MKIIKNNKPLQESLLVEEEDTTSTIVDVDSTSETKIADQVQAGSETEAKVTGDDDAALSGAEAKEVAEVAKEMAKIPSVGVALQTLCTDNGIVRALDIALRNATRNREDGIDDGRNNILITGLPGSGKTAIVKSWCKSRGINYFYLDAKNNDLESAINGFMMRDDKNPNTVTQGRSNKLNALRDLPGNKPTVLFLDELNRQTKASVRGSLLTLINEHRISGDDGDGYEHLPNILFAVACINPQTPGVKSIGELDDAELSRFATKIRYDSTPEDALKYFETAAKTKINVFENKLDAGEVSEEYFKSRIEITLRELELARKILSDDEFQFDGDNEVAMLRTEGGTPRTMFNSRLLEMLIDGCEGRKDEFLDTIKNRSEILIKNINMLNSILYDYEDPVIKFYRNDKGNLRGRILEDGESLTDKDDGLPTDELDISIFGGSGKSSNAAVSAIEARNRIQNALKI